MSPDLLLALLIIATPLLFVAVPGAQLLAATAHPTPKPAPALDERDLLYTDPREWVRQAEQAVDRAEGGKTDPIASVMQMERAIATTEHAHRLSNQARHEHQWVDDSRLCDPAPRFACVICGMYDVAHTHGHTPDPRLEAHAPDPRPGNLMDPRSSK